jgi:FkbM family methyltransferase
MTLEILRRVAKRTLPEAALLPLKKIHYAKVLRSSTGSEEPELVALFGLISPGDYILDIGANFGRYTYHFSRLSGPNGRVISMEPIPSTFQILKSNVAKLGLGNVVCINQAASDVTGFAHMEVPDSPSGGKNFYEAHISSVGGGTIPCVRLDDACLNLPQLDFIKCDVEGHELNVLTGAAALIAKFHPLLLIEIGGDPDNPVTNAGQAFRLLQHLGYAPHVPVSGKLRPKAEGERATNYFFLPERVREATFQLLR